MSIARKSESRLSVALGLALVLSAALNLTLVVRAGQQRETIEQQRVANMRLVGTRIDTLLVNIPSGESTILDLSLPGKTTVLYVFEPGCGWCVRNHSAISMLAAKAGSEIRFVGLSLSETGLLEYLVSHPMPFEIFSGVEPRAIESYNLAGTPRTLVIASDGTVVRNWEGAYAGDLRDEVERFFDVSIPEAAMEAGS